MELFTDAAKHIMFNTLRAFFKEHPEYPFFADSKETQIMIVDKYTVNLQSVATENLPALVVNRGPMSWRQRVLNQQGSGYGRGPNAPAKFMDLIDTSFRINCVSRQGLEAELLASYVFGLFSFFKDQIRKVRNIHEVRSAQLGVEQIGRSDSDVQFSVVPVTISMTLNQSWSSEETGAPLLKAICMNPEIMNRCSQSAAHWDSFSKTLK